MGHLTRPDLICKNRNGGLDSGETVRTRFQHLAAFGLCGLISRVLTRDWRAAHFIPCGLRLSGIASFFLLYSV